jgi:hypothetical protein
MARSASMSGVPGGISTLSWTESELKRGMKVIGTMVARKSEATKIVTPPPKVAHGLRMAKFKAER